VSDREVARWLLAAALGLTLALAATLIGGVA